MHPYGGIGRTAAAAVLVIGLSACGPAEADLPQKPVRAATPNLTPELSLNPEQRARVDKAWAAYLKLNSIYLKAAQTGIYQWDRNPEKRPMYPYAAGTYLAALEFDLGMMNEQGLLRVGDPKLTLRRVVSVSDTSILIEACIDDTGTDTIDKITRKSAAVAGQNKRYPVTLRAGLFIDNVWRWVESQAERASSC